MLVVISGEHQKLNIPTAPYVITHKQCMNTAKKIATRYESIFANFQVGMYECKRLK